MLLASLDFDEVLDSQLTDEECDGCEAEVEDLDESDEESDDELEEDVEEEEEEEDDVDDEDDVDEELDSLALLLELLLLLPSELLVLICLLLDRPSARTVR
jgi:hypothetical protein